VIAVLVFAWPDQRLADALPPASSMPARFRPHARSIADKVLVGVALMMLVAEGTFNRDDAVPAR